MHPAGESGSAGTVCDPRGFAVKFYTYDGRDPHGFAVKFYTYNGLWDLTGNNTPIFFIRDPKFVSSKNTVNTGC